MTDKIRWGILGTGSIAKAFAQGLSVLPDAVLAAVGSRTQASADEFGNLFGVPRRHASYEALAADPDIDAIYVSTPHPYHYDNAKLCLAGGKAVLCEKPFTLNAAEAADLIQFARQEKRFLMEAMWTRYIPAMVKVRELIAAGTIGEVRMIQADFGFRGAYEPEKRWLNPALGGGALLDVGIYPVSLAFMVMKTAPVEIVSMAHLGQTGVDEQSAMLFKYAGGELAILSSAVQTDTPWEAVIMGTEGRIKIHNPFFVPQKLTLTTRTGGDQILDLPMVGNGYNYEAAEVAACLRAGKLESDLITLDESLTIMQTLDTIRAQWGMVYPQEK